MKNKIDVSVIIPVYNGELYIEKCLNQMNNQTYDNFEVIIVDDGSTDRTYEIAQNFEMKKSIQIVKANHEGVSNARNLGVRCSNGDYIMFFDVDDEYDSDIIEKSVNAIIKYNADMVYLEQEKENEYGKEEIFTFEKFLERFLSDKIGVGCCDKLFKKDLMNDDFFDTKFKIYEDCLAQFNYLLNTKKIIQINEHKYHYIRRDNSSSNIKNFSDKFWDGFKVADIIGEKLNNTEFNFLGYKKKCNIYLRFIKLYYMRNGYKLYKDDKIKKYISFLKNIKRSESKRIFSKKTDYVRYYVLIHSTCLFKIMVNSIDRR